MRGSVKDGNIVKAKGYCWRPGEWLSQCLRWCVVLGVSLRFWPCLKASRVSGPISRPIIPYICTEED